MPYEGSLKKMLARAGPILERLKPIAKPQMAEIGVFTGYMSVHLLHMHPGLTLHCIDNWLGREHQPEAYRATGDAHANAQQAAVDQHKAIAMWRLGVFIDAGRALIVYGSC